MNVSQSGLTEVLQESLEMLLERPFLFAPKILSATISSMWLLAFVEGLASRKFFIASMPFIFFLGISVSVLVAEMVYRNLSFIQALQSIRDNIFSILGSSILLLSIFTVVSVPLSIGFSFYLVKGALTPLAVGLAVTLLAVLVLTFLLYFFPVALVESGSVLEGFRRSGGKSVSNYGEVSALTVISFMLFGLALFSQGVLKGLGYGGFVLGRILSSVFTTYFFVVSPEYYSSRP